MTKTYLNSKIVIFIFSLAFLFFILPLNILWLIRLSTVPSNYKEFYASTDLRAFKIKGAVKISKFVSNENRQKNNLSELSGVQYRGRFLSKSEMSHLKDVRSLFSRIKITTAAFLIILVILASLIGFRSPMKLIDSLIVCGTVLLVFTFILVFLATQNFDNFFTMLHTPFFSKNSWMFSDESLLIQLFPLPFWKAMAKKLIFNMICESLALIFITLTAKKLLTKKG